MEIPGTELSQWIHNMSSLIKYLQVFWVTFRSLMRDETSPEPNINTPDFGKVEILIKRYTLSLSIGLIKYIWVEQFVFHMWLEKFRAYLLSLPLFFSCFSSVEK